MAMRSASCVVSGSSLGRLMTNIKLGMISLRLPRRFSSDGRKGGVLDDKERAQETVYIQKMERERLQKLKAQMDKDNADKGKEAAEKKSKDDTHKD